MFDKLKSIFDKKIEEENDQFDTVQIAISTLMIQTAVYDGVFDEQEKSEILELYLNSVYFGHGNYGIQSASIYYFGKEASVTQIYYLLRGPIDFN